MIVPGGGNSIYNNGKLTIRFDLKLSGTAWNEALWIDNINIVADEGCAAATQLLLDNFESSTNGWSSARRETSQQTSFTKFLGRYANENPAKTYNVPTALLTQSW